MKTPNDQILWFANRLLLIHMFNRGSLGSVGRFVPAYGMVDCVPSKELLACLEVKRKLVKEFCEYALEGDEMATPAEFIRRWLAAIERCGEVAPATIRRYQETRQWDEAQRTFAQTRR